MQGDGVHGDPAAFTAPPVIEVALAVEFPSRPHLGALRLARLHERWSSAYPQTEEHPALPASWSLGTDGSINVEFTAGLPLLRLWMLSATGERLVQVQHDRLILNWRRTSEDAAYPGFASSLVEFMRLWQDLGAYEGELDLPSPDPRVVEVTYINRVPVSEDQMPGTVFTVLSNEPSTDLPPLIVTNVVAEGRVDHPWGLGHASTSLQRVPVSAGAAYHLSITTRLSITSRPHGDAVHDLLDAAHRRSVDPFLQSTTPTAHMTWGDHGEHARQLDLLRPTLASPGAEGRQQPRLGPRAAASRYR